MIVLNLVLSPTVRGGRINGAVYCVLRDDSSKSGIISNSTGWPDQWCSVLRDDSSKSGIISNSAGWPDQWCSVLCVER